MKKIDVFIQNAGSELIATFYDEDIYVRCVPELEQIAREHGGVITETVEEYHEHANNPRS